MKSVCHFVRSRKGDLSDWNGRRQGTGRVRGKTVLPGQCTLVYFSIFTSCVTVVLLLLALHTHTLKVAIEKKQTLFIDDPTKVPGLEKNEDWVKFGYGYYVGAPGVFGELKGQLTKF